jgi:hypothetical protein
MEIELANIVSTLTASGESVLFGKWGYLRSRDCGLQLRDADKST